MKKKRIIVILMLLFTTTNVYAITSNDVTYDNNGTTENLTESLDTLYNELKKYKTGGSVQGNQMLAGATGYSKGVLITGTIASKGATTYTPGTSNQTIASGQYLSGAQTIAGDANLVAGNIAKGKKIFGVTGTYTSDANVGVGQILSGYTAYVNGNKITGTIPSKGAATFTPGTSNQTINAGQYLSGTQTIQGDGDLVAGNIKSGVNIFGVTGTYDGSASSGKMKVAEGTAGASSTSISFTPSRDISEVVMGGRRYGGQFTAYIKDAYGNNIASTLITNSADCEGGMSCLTQQSFAIVSCSLKKGQTYTLYIPGTGTSTLGYYAFVIYV